MRRMIATLVATLIAAPPAMAQGKAEPAHLDLQSGSWLSDDDYPAEALRKGEQGSVAVEFDVTERGRIENCHVTTSSGSLSLDAATCPMVLKGPHYRPAKDEAGKKVRSSVTRKVNWSLPVIQ